MTTHIDCTRLPLDQVDHPAVRDAAEAWHQAQSDLRAAQRAVSALDGGRLRAREADAEEAAAARRAGKPGTAHKHEQAYDKALHAAEHEQRVATALVRQTLGEYERVLDDHADEWRDDLDREAAAADELWDAALSTLVALHEARTRAHGRRRMLGANGGFPAGAVRFRPEQLADSVTGAKLELARLDDPAARWRQRALVRVDDVLVALQADEPEQPEPMPAFAVADRLRESFEHARTVDRGYAIDEDNAPAINRGSTYINGQPVAVYVPSNDGGED